MDLLQNIGYLLNKMLHRGLAPKPNIVICHTVKGKGVSFMEDNPSFHGKAPNDDELARALEELS